MNLIEMRNITRRYTDKAIEFITTNRERPFFLYLPHSMPHVPLFVPEDVYDPDPQNAYTCTIQHLDAEIGRLMKTVRELGLSDHTYVLFTTDNGPWLQFKNHAGSADPLREGKGTTFEGGQRVPCIVWAPARVPAGISVWQRNQGVLLAKGNSIKIEEPIYGARLLDILARRNIKATFY